MPVQSGKKERKIWISVCAAVRCPDPLPINLQSVLQKRFGLIEGVTDKNYITNSYHVHVTENINAFDKLKFESQFQKLSPGGAISYVEVPNMQDNIDAVIAVTKIHLRIILRVRLELNTKSDYCMELWLMTVRPKLLRKKRAANSSGSVRTAGNRRIRILNNSSSTS